MKKCFFYSVFTFSMCILNTNAQQLYHFNQSLFNDLILNPAVAGTSPCKIIGLDFRKQWVGFDGSPTTQNIFFHGSFLKKTGLGAIFFNDKAGAIGMTGVELDYSYHAIKTKEHLLTFGLGATVQQYAIDQSGFKPEIAVDPALSGSNPSKIMFDASAGAYYKNQFFLISLGLKNLIQPSLNISSTNYNKLIRNYFLNVSYNSILNYMIRWEPSVFIRSIGKPFPQIDLSSKFIFYDLYWLGVAYRLQDAAIVFAGIDVGPFTIGYSYEYSISLINPYTSGSHEVFLRFDFCKKNTGNIFTVDSEELKRKKRGYKSVICPIW